MTNMKAAVAMLCEVATEPSRELDCRIWCVMHDLDFDVAVKVVPNLSQWSAPYYTTSVDSAITLVPEGWDGSIPVSMYGRCVELWKRGVVDSNVFGRSVNPALSLCSAALRAQIFGR